MANPCCSATAQSNLRNNFKWPRSCPNSSTFWHARWVPPRLIWKSCGIAFNRRRITRFLSGSISPVRQRLVHSAQKKRCRPRWNKLYFFSNRTSVKRKQKYQRRICHKERRKKFLLRTLVNECNGDVTST